MCSKAEVETTRSKGFVAIARASDVALLEPRRRRDSPLGRVQIDAEHLSRRESLREDLHQGAGKIGADVEDRLIGEPPK